MNAQDFKPGDRVIYVPNHANGDRRHPDCEHGVVTSVGSSGNVFVMYAGKSVQATYPSDLVFE